MEARAPAPAPPAFLCADNVACFAWKSGIGFALNPIEPPELDTVVLAEEEEDEEEEKEDEAAFG